MEMVKLALRGIRASIGRLILTAIAITAGVGFVSGSFILADSLTKTFTSLFEQANDQIDASVQLEELEFGTAERTIPESLVEEVAELDEVGEAVPSVSYTGQGAQAPFVIVDDDGNRLENQGPPIITFSWNGDTDGELLTIEAGEPPVGADQVAIDSAYAERAGVSAGDTITLATPDGQKDFTLATVVNFSISGGANFVMFDFPTAQTLYDKEGVVDTIELTRATGVSTDEMVAAVNEVIPAGTEVLDRAEVVDQQTADFEAVIGILRNGLLAFAGIALFVSLFIIYNTFTILVSQRLHQIGMLRAVGATRGQIRINVLVEAVIVGIIGSVLGMALGFGLAVMIKGAFAAGDFFPDTPTVVNPRTIIVSLVVGIGATVVSALLPAFMAGRVTPVAAMRNETPSRSSRSRRVVLGSVVLTIGLILLGLGLFASGQDVAPILWELGTGVVLTFIGVAMLSGLFAGPVVNLVGRPWFLGASLFGLGVLLPVLTFTVGDGLPDGIVSGITFVLKMFVSIVAALTGASILATTIRGGKPLGIGGSAAGLEGRLARQNASRSPQRTAATATALTIGIALVSTVGVVGESLKASFIGTLEQAIHADLFVYSEQGGTFSGGLADGIQEVEGVSAISRFRVNQVRLGANPAGDDDITAVGAYNSETGTEIIDFDITEGSSDDLADNGVLVFRDEADERGLALGDTLTAEFPADVGSEDLTIVGIFEDNSVVGTPLLIDLSVYEQFVSETTDAFVGVAVSDDADFQAVKAEVVGLTDEFGGASAQDNAEYTETIENQIDGLITLINYLLAFALFIAFLGVINTIVLSVIERTREIGLLRAVGMTRPQLRSAIRWEAVIVCIFGALLGIVLGVLFAWAGVSAIPEGIINKVAIPYESVMFAILVAALAGVVAALLPARRASNLDVLDAIATGGG